jgi:Flp pilus assembly protein TadD
MSLLGPATERAPDIPELWLTLGSACRETGDAERANLFYREALRLRPGYPQALGNLADLLADNGGVDEALMLYHEVVAGAPHDAQARLNRAILRLLKGDLKHGWRDYEYRLRVTGDIVSGHRIDDDNAVLADDDPRVRV